MDLAESDSDFDYYSDPSDNDDHDHDHDDDDGDDDDDDGSMYDGQVQNLLSDLDRSIDRIDGYLAFERGFSYGDIVMYITDPFGQMGQIVNMEVMVELESNSGKIIENINSRKLVRVGSFAEGDHVVHGSWLGKVVKVYDLVKILLDDGTKCTISTRDTKALAPISPRFLEDGPFMYVPGQRVRVECCGFESWLCGMWSGEHREGTICSVESGPILVNWITSIISDSDVAPPRLQEAKNVSRLSSFPHVNWQLGDWCKLPSRSLQNSEMAAEDQVSNGFKLPGHSQMESMKTATMGSEHLYCISRTRTYLDVLWQDGNLSSGLDPQSLAPVSTVGDHDFWPEQFVLEKSPADNLKNYNAQCLGIVQSMDSKESIVNVKWVSQDLCQSNNLLRIVSEESHSAYELMEHPDFAYCLGDIVFRLPKNGNFTITEVEHNCYADSYSSCIGNVVGCKEGSIEVKWVNGSTSKVMPTEILGIEKINTPIARTGLHAEPSEGAARQKFPAQGLETIHRDTVGLLWLETNRNDATNLWKMGTYLYPQTAVAFLADVASNIFGLNASRSQCVVADESNSSDDPGRSCPKEIRPPSSEIRPPNSERTYVFDKCSETFEDENGQNGEHLHSDDCNLESLMHPKLVIEMAPKVETLQFKKFDIVEDCSDHYFANGICDTSQVKRAWWRKVQEEWSILEKDLPDGISVRVYEDRIDLLRASIIGAEGTPYNDALFFFDICFPPEFPHEPPVVHYISNGLRLNPNLYESGKVCLSLLKTWAGTGTEMWDPKSSTLLQVLLSLQALVLNAKPYFNEAGYDKQIGRAEGERNSTTYNENSFLLSRKSMLYQLHRPPKHFEALVEQHFSSRSLTILTACKAYIDGTSDCFALGSGGFAVPGGRGTSAGFKIMLAKLVPTLAAAFSELGIDCSEFLVSLPAHSVKEGA